MPKALGDGLHIFTLCLLSIASIAGTATRCEAQLEAPPALRVSAEVVGGALGLVLGAGLGAGVTALGLAAIDDANEPSATSVELHGPGGEASYDGVFEKILFVAFIGVPVTIAATLLGLTFGTYGAGELFGGDGKASSTLLGAAIGLGAQVLAVLGLAAAGALDDDLAVPLVAATTLLSVGGAVIGYASSDVSVSPVVGRFARDLLSEWRLRSMRIG
jgi:hypothetical protein